MTCACRSAFTVQYSLIYKKGVFVNIPHNDVRQMAVKLLSRVPVEPTLLPLTGERMEHRTTIETKEASLDIRIRGFWIRAASMFRCKFFDQNACLALFDRWKKKKSVTITNTLCKSKKEPLFF